jgi:hypothetical protein
MQKAPPGAFSFLALSAASNFHHTSNPMVHNRII